MENAVPRPWAPRRCSHGPPGSTDARRAEGTCGGPGQRTSETVRKGSSHKKSERAVFIEKRQVALLVDLIDLINMQKSVGAQDQTVGIELCSFLQREALLQPLRICAITLSGIISQTKPGFIFQLICTDMRLIVPKYVHYNTE